MLSLIISESITSDQYDCINKYIQSKGCTIEATFKPIKNRAKLARHKYYRGYILQSYAEAIGEKDIERVHFNLKKEFLKIDISDISEIPENKFNRIILLSDGVTVTGYIPSTGTLNDAEFKEYIIKIEDRLFNFLNSGLVGNNIDAAIWRNEIMK